MLVTMNVNNITVPTMYTHTPPKKEKINKHMRYYVEHGQFKHDIVVTQRGILTDGYCDYIVAVVCGMNTVQCRLSTKLLKYGQGRERTRKINKPHHKRKVLYKRQGGKCAICRKHLQIDDYTSINDYMTLDHILPVSRGGCNGLKNLQGLCKACNLAKGNKIIYQTKGGYNYDDYSSENIL